VVRLAGPRESTPDGLRSARGRSAATPSSSRDRPGTPIRVPASGPERAPDAPMPIPRQGLTVDAAADSRWRGRGTGRTRRPGAEAPACKPTDPFLDLNRTIDSSAAGGASPAAIQPLGRSSVDWTIVSIDTFVSGELETKRDRTGSVVRTVMAQHTPTGRTFPPSRPYLRRRP
jgi:hypothetical protein